MKKIKVISIMLAAVMIMTTSTAFADDSINTCESTICTSGEVYEDTSDNSVAGKAVEIDMKSGTAISGKENAEKHNYFRFSLESGSIIHFSGSVEHVGMFTELSIIPEKYLGQKDGEVYCGTLRNINLLDHIDRGIVFLPAGKYYIDIVDNVIYKDFRKEYEIVFDSVKKWDNEKEPNNTKKKATAIKLEQLYKGMLHNRATLEGCDEDYFKYTVKKPGKYRITVTHPECAFGDSISQFEVNGTGIGFRKIIETDEKLVINLTFSKKGTKYVSISSDCGWYLGSYTVKVQKR